MLNKNNPNIGIFSGVMVCILAVFAIYITKDRSFFTIIDFLWFILSCILFTIANVVLAIITTFLFSKKLTKIVFSYFFFVMCLISSIFVAFETYRVTFIL